MHEASRGSGRRGPPLPGFQTWEVLDGGRSGRAVPQPSERGTVGRSQLAASVERLEGSQLGHHMTATWAQGTEAPAAAQGSLLSQTELPPHQGGQPWGPIKAHPEKRRGKLDIHVMQGTKGPEDRALALETDGRGLMRAQHGDPPRDDRSLPPQAGSSPTNSLCYPNAGPHIRKTTEQHSLCGSRHTLCS